MAAKFYSLTRCQGVWLLPFFGAVGLAITPSVEAQNAVPPPPDLAALDRQAAPQTVFVIPQGQAEIDGDARTALGGSLTDSLSAGLLKTGLYRVVEKWEPKAETDDEEDANADSPPVFELRSRMVGELGVYRLTVRKASLPGGEVIEIYEATVDEVSPNVFDLVDQVLDDLVPPAARPEATPAEQSAQQDPTTEWSATPIEESDIKTSNDEPQLQKPRYSKIPAIRIPAPSPPQVAETPTYVKNYVRPKFGRQKIGTVSIVDDDWKFVIIDIAPGKSIKPHERLEILYDRGDQRVPYAELKIDRIEGEKIIANFGDQKAKQRIVFPGELVYVWRQIN